MFEIGQIFEGEYPPEVAMWCNEGGKVYIEEIEPIDGVRRFEIKAIPEPTQEEIEAQELARLKQERAAAVEALTVEVDGMVFNADEASQERMARTITAAKALNYPDDATTEWTLADDSAAQVTVNQLARALDLAGKEQTKLWRVPYTTIAANAEGDSQNVDVAEDVSDEAKSAEDGQA